MTEKTRMELHVFEDIAAMGKAAADQAEERIRSAIESKGEANIVLATGASQFETLKSLVTRDVDWSKVMMFHLDEYIGMSDSHPASFRRYLNERFIQKVPALRSSHLIAGDAADPASECQRIGQLIAENPIDVMLAGIGENGHVAFNDPPADFETQEAYLVVDLDERCRQQQLGEGWFPTLEDVPTQAISMSVHQIMLASTIILSVPDARKAEAVRNTFEGEVTNLCPASILQQHADCRLLVDKPASSLLTGA
jgi:glucosamine-6-phosphate deaminase